MPPLSYIVRRVEVEEGGETALPLAQPIDAAQQSLEHPSACALKGTMAVRPRKRDALLMFDMDFMGKEDRAALHASCPTLKVMGLGRLVWKDMWLL